MKYGAYDSIDSVLTLEEEAEQIKMFDFIRDMVELIDDKQKVLGIFADVPEKLRILPGLDRKFKDFLAAVKNLKLPTNSENRKRKGSKDEKETEAKTKKTDKPEKKEPTTESEETVTLQMRRWFKKKNLIKNFHITTSSDGSFVFNCDECGSEKKLSKHEGKTSCSNAQNHYKVVYVKTLLKRRSIVR